MYRFQPKAIIMQCGADSLAWDRLGPFNLTIEGHGRCLEHAKKFNIPMLVLGGGGYTIKNVARCWAYETAVCLGKEIPNKLPVNDYYEYYGPDYTLQINVRLHNQQSHPHSKNLTATRTRRTTWTTVVR